MRPRDLASHRTGLPRHDFVWVNSPMDLAEMVEPSASSSRAGNCGPPSSTTTSCISPSAISSTGGRECPGTRFVRERIFKPLGMNDSGFTIPEYHGRRGIRGFLPEGEGGLRRPALPVPAEKLMYGARASGSVNTTAEDMCAWMIVHLQVVSARSEDRSPAAVIRETHAPQIPMPWNPA